MADKGAQALLGELQEVRNAQGAPEPDPDEQPIEERLQELGIDPASLAQASDDDLKAVADKLFMHGQRKAILSKFFAPLPGGGFDWTTDPDGNPTGLDQTGKPTAATPPPGLGPDDDEAGESGESEPDENEPAAPSSPAPAAAPAAVPAPAPAAPGKPAPMVKLP